MKRFARTATSLLLLICLVLGMTAAAMAADESYHGAIYTTLGDGNKVNQNLYTKKSDVYLNGGPQNTSSQGLPDGTYYYQVTDPSGAMLLSTDNAVCRQAQVVGGIIFGAVGPACKHADGIANASNGGSIAVQLIPYANTPNDGGEYKVSLIRQSSTTTIDPLNPTVIHFLPKDDKTDNFKVIVELPSLSILTEVNVTDGILNGEPLGAVQLPVVTWDVDSLSYKVNHGLVNLVTQYPGWSVTVKDRAFVKVNLEAPVGAVTFSLFNNDQCIPDVAHGFPQTFGSSSTWTSVGAGIYSSGFSLPFTFTSGGMWGFQARYQGADYGNVSDLGCEAWPIPKVSTDIYRQASPDVKVTGGSALVGSTIYDTSAVDTQDATSTGVIPAGSFVEFRRYQVAGCTGTVTTENVNLTSGAQTANASSSTSTLDARFISYRAIFHSGNPNAVPNVADSVCEELTAIGKPLDVSKTVSGSIKKTYSWTIDKSVDSNNQTNAGPSTFNYSVKVNQAGLPVDSDAQASGTITVSNPNFWDVTGIDVTDAIDNGGTCTVTDGTGLTVSPGTANKVVLNYSCTYTGSPALTGTNTATATFSDSSITATSATGTAGYEFTVNSVNKDITVKDTYDGGSPITLGTLSGSASLPLTSANYTYAHTVTPALGQCLTKDNTATIVETEQSDSESVQACGIAKITIVKKTDPANSPEEFSFTGSLGNFKLTGVNGSNTKGPITISQAGVITVSEVLGDSQWRLTRIQCSDKAIVTPIENGVSINLQVPADIKCTFWNTLPRMTGGGSVFTATAQPGVAANTRVTHGFELYCGVTKKRPNNLEINWGSTANGKKSENAFHMDNLLTAVCDGNATSDPAPNPEMPNAPFNRYTGSGTGSLNKGKANTYYARWVLVDNGEPGSNDTFALTIWNVADLPGGVVPASATTAISVTPIITFPSIKLDMGNHQAH